MRENCGELASNKRIPDGFKDYPAEVLARMLRGMMIGDGHWGPYGQRYYTTTSKRLADDVQEIFQKTGADAWVRPQDLTGYGSKAKRLQYTVRERMADGHQPRGPGSRRLPRAGLPPERAERRRLRPPRRPCHLGRRITA